MKIIKKILFKLKNKIEIDKENDIFIDPLCKMRNCKIKIRGQNNLLKINKYVSLNGVNLEIRGKNCQIVIEEGTVIGKNTYISSKEEGIKIFIGKNCMFSRNINILSSDGHKIYQNSNRINFAKSIIIEDNVWLADNVVLLKGTFISEGSIVGTGTVVTKQFKEKNIIIAGNPAIIVKENIKWEK
ncbi:acyltransferase [Fusobacterium varium]|uniref:acyltransferase n=1 Tax=Fusobacterium TaxID=848 RepID=UPI0015A0FF72|nr:acyltransferase [uncultured Fusobacterium sp.]